MKNELYCLNLNTIRIHLKPLNVIYSNFFYELLNSKGWIEYIGNRNILTIADAEKYINKLDAAENVTVWIVEEIETKHNLGIITFIKKDYLEFYDIGYAFCHSILEKALLLKPQSWFVKILSTKHQLKPFVQKLYPKICNL
jgi:ribosomal-protein-alanine N-acetyltransferase